MIFKAILKNEEMQMADTQKKNKCWVYPHMPIKRKYMSLCIQTQISLRRLYGVHNKNCQIEDITATIYVMKDIN